MAKCHTTYMSRYLYSPIPRKRKKRKIESERERQRDGRSI
jgi:hypothetical protein